MTPFRFAVHTSSAPTMAAWRDRARAAEALGYSALHLTDHLGTQYGPLVGATVAAEATSELHVGVLVLNNDLRHPVPLAMELATLGLAAEGRLEVGFGAGWMRVDYEATGIAHDPPAVRVARLGEAVRIVKQLWSTGSCSFEGDHYRIRDATCPLRPATPPRVIIGGGSKGILTLAGREADTVALNQSLAAGVLQADPSAGASPEDWDRRVGWVHQASGGRAEAPELQMTPAAAMIVGSRRAAQRSATMLGFAGEDALDSPVVLIGTVDELCERLTERRERWGMSNIVVPGPAMEGFAPVVARLAGT